MKEKFKKIQSVYRDLYYPGQAKDPIIYKRREYFKEHPYGIEGKGQFATRFFKRWKYESVCDVGCGSGEFIGSIRGVRYGVDIVKSPLFNKNANGAHFIEGSAWNIPLKDKSVDYITSFDVLEHIPETYIRKTLEEFSRIAKKGFVFFISYTDTAEHPLLHLTIRPEKWWIGQILKYTKAIRYKKVLQRPRSWWKELIIRFSPLYKEKQKFLIFRLRGK